MRRGGALIAIAGVSLVVAARSWRVTRNGRAAYTALRSSFGSVILLALEILVAADLVRTVAVAPTLDNVVILGVIVLIRTLLSFSLEVEIEGVLPWRRSAAAGGAGRDAPR